MANFDEINENYSSDLIGDLLGSITPEEQEQVDYKMKLSAKIYAGLKSKGWKSIDLAKALDLKSASLVSKWLSGTHNFTVDTLVDIQRVLDIRLLDIELFQPTSLRVDFTVSVEPSSLGKDIYEPTLQRLIDESGGLQPTTIEVVY